MGPELTGTWLGVLSLQRWLWGAESIRGAIFQHSAISLEEGSTHPPPPGVSGGHGCLSAGAVPRLLAGAVGLLGPQHQPLSGPVLPPGAAHPAPGPGDSYCSGPCLGVPWESVQALHPLPATLSHVGAEPGPGASHGGLGLGPAGLYHSGALAGSEARPRVAVGPQHVRRAAQGTGNCCVALYPCLISGGPAPHLPVEPHTPLSGWLPLVSESKALL